MSGTGVSGSASHSLTQSLRLRVSQSPLHSTTALALHSHTHSVSVSDCPGVPYLSTLRNLKQGDLSGSAYTHLGEGCGGCLGPRKLRGSKSFLRAFLLFPGTFTNKF